MNSQIMKDSQINKKLVLSIFFIVFTIFLFTSDGHRYSGDEDLQNLQAIRMVTLEPHELYVDGESRTRFEHPAIYPPKWQGEICYNYILCSPAKIGNSVTQVPFLFINHTFNIITEDTVTWSTDDFTDLHYIFWRNSINPDFTFMELFYGPFYIALAISVFFLICRTFNYQIRTSLILTFLLALTTTFWAYSQTSLNSVPFVFVLLLGFYFFRRFQKNNSMINLIYCGICLGFGFMIREEMAMVIIVLMGFFVYNLRKSDTKIKNILCYLIPQILFYSLKELLEWINRGLLSIGVNAVELDNVSYSLALAGNVGQTGYPTALEMLAAYAGLLFSPGVGLFFFVPILFTVFFSFPDFFKKHKIETVFILALVSYFIVQMGSFGHWHGLNSWGARYLIPLIPFLLLPLGASIESRNFKKMMIVIVILGAFGFLFNLAYTAMDVSWFVWGQPAKTGLYSLGWYMTELYLHQATIWTFEYSQLTNTIIMFFTGLQVDNFLLKLMGSGIFTGIIFSLLFGQGYILYRILNHYKTSELINKNTL